MENSFKDRESQFEAKFAHDEELKFKVVAHRNKMFAAWVAEQLGPTAAPGYADALVEFGFGRDATDLVDKAAGDLESHGVAAAAIKVRKAFERLTDQAETEVNSAVG